MKFRWNIWGYFYMREGGVLLVRGQQSITAKRSRWWGLSGRRWFFGLIRDNW